MKCFTRTHRLLLSGIVAAAAAFAAPLTSPAHAGIEGPEVPTKIAVEAGNKVFLVGHAVGVQIYRCNASSGGFAWGPSTPRADLFDDDGKVIATHFGGPTWKYKDGSAVVGQRVDGITVDPTAIPWLLLSKASTTVGADGDRLANTTFIQRTSTTGGLAPAAAACNTNTAGAAVEIPYTADYYFWKKSGS